MMGDDALENRVTERLGITFKYVTGDWGEIQQMAREGKIDGIRLLTKNKQREDCLSFSKPHHAYTIAIYALEGGESYKTLYKYPRLQTYFAMQ